MPTRIAAFLYRDLCIARHYRVAWALDVAEIVLTISAFFFFARLLGDRPSQLGPYHNYFAYVLVGVAVSNYFFISLNQFTTSIRESQLNGSLQPMLLTKGSLIVTFVSSHIAVHIAQLLRLAAYCLVATLGFGFSPHGNAWCASVLILVLSIAAFLGLGLLSTSFILVFKKGDPFNSALNMVTWVVSGVMFPVDLLPGWLRALAHAFPLTAAISGLRKTTLLGAGLLTVSSELQSLALTAGILLTAGCCCFRLALNKALRDGTLGHY